MLESQERRGPDARRIWSAGDVALGHGLLATTPEDDLGAQPFCTADEAIVVALDGRLDNREDLAEATSTPERGTTDAALVAAAYGRWGETFADHLLGDFAVVVWDGRRRALLCARDPLAGRPLYFTSDARTFRCASEPWALFAGTAERPTPRFEAMALFLAERYVERGGTLFKGVFALAPGASLVVTAGALRHLAPAWPDVERGMVRGTAAEHAEQFHATLREAVRVRMRVRGPIAAHVSGGLDSSSVAVLATQHARAAGTPPPLLVRCVFPGLACDEAFYSQAVADHLGLPLASVTMPGDLTAYRPARDVVPRSIFYNPIARMLTRMAELGNAHGARVTLTGAGSDQFLQPTGHELTCALLRGDARAAAALSGLDSAPLSLAPYRMLLHEGVRRALPERLRLGVRALLGRGDGLPSWLSPAALRIARAARPDAPRAHTSWSVKKLVTLLAHSPDYAYSFALTDQLAAASSSELRHPFFDRRVIDLLLSFPPEVRAESPPGKALLRRAMGSDLPRAVRDRVNAAEFSPFAKRILVDAHGDHVAELLRGGQLARTGLIDPAAAAGLVAQARSDAPVLRELISLVSLEVWLRQVAERPRG